jgi:hypothetical protein
LVGGTARSHVDQEPLAVGRLRAIDVTVLSGHGGFVFGDYEVVRRDARTDETLCTESGLLNELDWMVANSETALSEMADTVERLANVLSVSLCQRVRSDSGSPLTPSRRMRPRCECTRKWRTV